MEAPPSNKISTRLIALMILALAGLAFSVALSQHFYELRSGAAGFKSYCNLNSKMNCDVVATSSWAEFLPGLPLSSVAAGWYLGLFFIYLSAIGFSSRREAVRLAFLLNGVSVLASLYYLFVMTAQLGTFCLLCLALDGINLLSLGIVFSLRPKLPGERAIDFGRWKGLGGILALCLFVAIVGLKGLDSLSDRSEELKEHAQAILARDPIALNLAPTGLVIGPADAAVTIVEFSDFQCPFCRVGAFALHSVLSRYPHDVRVIMKPFPLDPSCNHYVTHAMHPVACEAAKVAVCAAAQGKFEPTYEEIFQNQEHLAPGRPAEYAQAAGADPAKLAQCVAANATLTQLQTSIEEGKRLGVESTPTFYVNGRRVDGAEPLPVWTRVIDQILKH